MVLAMFNFALCTVSAPCLGKSLFPMVLAMFNFALCTVSAAV